MAASMPHLDIGTYTHQGQVRPRNEDSLQIYPDAHPAGQLFVVADGVGGENYGQDASQYAVRRIGELYYQYAQQYPHEAVENLLRQSLTQTNTEIYDMALQRGTAGHMGTTAVAVVIREKILSLAWVGDSRGYVVSRKRNQTRQITVDHNEAAEMVRGGQLTPEQALSYERRNVLSRSLGGNPQVEVDTRSGVLEDNDLLVVCSDGLSRYVNDAEIGTYTLGQATSQFAAELLGDLANKRGGKDNISVIVVHMGQRAATVDTLVASSSEGETIIDDGFKPTIANPRLMKTGGKFPSTPLVAGSVIGFMVVAFAVILFMYTSKPPEIAANLTQTTTAQNPIPTSGSPTSNPDITSTLRPSDTPIISEAQIIETDTAATATVLANAALEFLVQTATEARAQANEQATANAVGTQVMATAHIQETQTEAASNGFGEGRILRTARSTDVYASVGGNVVYSLPANTAVRVMVQPDNGIWFYTDPLTGINYYHVQPMNSSQGYGWVKAEDLYLPVSATAVPTATITPTPDEPQANFGINSYVRVNSGANGWLQPFPYFNGDQNNVIPPGSILTVIGGPQYNAEDGGNWWWQLRSGTGATGWLQQYQLQATTDVPTPTSP